MPTLVDAAGSSGPVRELSIAEATAFLSRHTFGRLAICLTEEPHIVPVNYATPVGQPRPEALYIRTAPGDKLFAAAVNKRVAFEVDEVADTGATSVIAYGHARIVDDAGELARVTSLGLTPWVATYKTHYVAIDIRHISGRQFQFGPEPDGVYLEPPS